MEAELPNMDVVNGKLGGMGLPGVRLRVRGMLRARLMLWYLGFRGGLFMRLTRMPVELAERRLKWALVRVRVEQQLFPGDPWRTIADGWDLMRTAR